VGKTPAFQFYPGDWLKDPHLSMCSPATRGIWMDLLCAMHENDRSGQITGTTDQIARLCRCTAVDLDHAISELQTTKTADVTKRHEIVTIINRRMSREYKDRVSARERKRLERDRNASIQGCHTDVTPSRARLSSSSSSTTKENTPLSPPPPKKSVCDPAKKYRDRFTDEGKRLHEEALNVLHYLNEQADRHLPDNYNGLSVIVDRLHDGYSVESLKQIIDTKLHDPHFQKRRNLYTPETLFKAENIQRYLCETPEDFAGGKPKDKPKPQPEPDFDEEIVI